MEHIDFKSAFKFGVVAMIIATVVAILSGLWAHIWLIAVLLWAAVGAMVVLHTFPSFSARLRGAVAPAATAEHHGPVGTAQIPRYKGAAAIFGDADWMGWDEAEVALPINGGVPVGECYRIDQDASMVGVKFNPRDPKTWGKGGQGFILAFDPEKTGSGMGMVFAGSGGYKSTSTTIPCGLAWVEGSLVVHDPSREAGPMLAEYRESLGQKVVFLDPQAEGKYKGGINILESINPKSPTAQIDIRAIAATLAGLEPAGKGGKADIWTSRAAGLIEALILAEVYETAPAQDRAPTLKSMYSRYANGSAWLANEYLPLLAESKVVAVRQAATAFVGMAEETFSSICNNVSDALSWLSIDALAEMVSTATFSLSELPGGNLSVFIQIPTAILRTTPGVSRLIVEAMIYAMEAADGQHAGKGCLFLIDEAFQLKYVAALEKARDIGRKTGARVLLMYQSEAQLVDQWGSEGAKAWIDSTSMRLYACVEDIEAAKKLSETLGYFTMVQMSESQNTSDSVNQSGGQGGNSKSQGTSTSSGVSAAPAQRALMTPQEIRDMRSDECVILLRNHPPVRCSRPIYFRRDDMKDLVGANRFSARAAAETEANAQR